MIGSGRKHRRLSEDEMSMLLDHSDKSSPIKMRNTIALHILAGTGLKVFEATDLLVADINSGIGFLTAGKGKKRRTLPMDARTVPLMQEYITEYRSRFILRHSNRKCTCDNLLLSYLLTPLSRDAFFALVTRIGRELGLELGPELIRHSFTYHLWQGDTASFLQHTGINAGTTRLLDLPEHKADLKAELRKYHPRF